MPPALAAGMHAIFFGLKRAWHGSLRMMRHALASMGLTAARFDLLYAVDACGSTTIAQCELRRRLGVNRTTISRMLRSLEELGMLVRERSSANRRTLWIRLTRLGRRRIRAAVKRFIGRGAAQLVVDCGIVGPPWVRDTPAVPWPDDAACLYAAESLELLLGRMREVYGDSATLYYPWHPDD